MAIKIGTRLAIAVSLLLALAVSALAVVAYLGCRAKLEMQILAQAGQEAGLNATRLLAPLELARHDLLFLAEGPPALKSLQQARQEADSGPAYERAAATAQQLFAALLRNRPEYMQIRYLDERGRERVRLDRRGEAVNAVAAGELQDKADRPYFSATMKLPARAVHVSPLDLNREHGRIEVPHRPTLRLATPLFDAGGRRQGILAINLDGGALLARLQYPAGILYLVDRDGFFLHHPEGGKTFGFELGRDFRLRDLHPRLAGRLAAADEEAEFWQGGGEPGGAAHVHGFRKVYYDPGNPAAYWALVFEIPADTAFAALVPLRRTFAWLGTLIAALGGAAAWLYARRFARPLAMLSAAAERMAAGDLDVAVPQGERSDELGRLLAAFRRMLAGLREIQRELRSGIDVLAASTSDILASAMQVASSSAQTATAVGQTGATVDEVKQTALLAAQKAALVSESTQRTAQTSQQGRNSVEESIAAMGLIQEQMQRMTESIVRLSEQGLAIGEIIATVNDLAEQSNMLAVNAAIEAAKAGEQGKGFAVLAQEVKSLAEQSKRATAQVRAILSEIRKATAGAVLASEQGSQTVAAGVKRTSEAGAAIRALARSMDEAVQAATQIVVSAQQQEAGMDQVALAMQNIRQASALNVASTRQTENAAQQLHELGLKLQALMARYRV